MKKIVRLKSASMMLFWFGVLAQSITVIFVTTDFIKYGYSPYLIRWESNELTLINAFNIAYFGFIHLVHVLAGYFLAKGTKKGIALGIGIAALEIIGAFSSSSLQYLQTASWITIRIYFVIVIFLIITGKKDLLKLQSVNWRPWRGEKIY